MGEFLKELELTEGRATGIPTILKALQDNASPAPRFYTDDDRTFFEVELFMHADFTNKELFTLESYKLIATMESIDDVLNRLISFAGINHENLTLSTIAGIQAGAIAESTKLLENQLVEVIYSIDSAIVSAIVSAIAGAIAESELKLLAMAKEPQDRETLLTLIGVTNHSKNYKNYMLTMVNKSWLSMTIPSKPTSPNQKYYTTLKGRLVLAILKKSGSRLP